jgi:multiple sugar transport system substrate-binding protein
VTSSSLTRRRVLQKASAGAAAFVLSRNVAAQSDRRPFSGVNLNVSTFSAPFPKLLIQLLPEFEAATGIKVTYDTPSFPVYNQRADLELSTHGSAYDVLNVTFIYSGRWINAGWFTPLDGYIADREKTPADWDVEDFLPGLRAPETGKDGKLYGIPWNVDVTIGTASRFDLIKEAGLSFPETTDDLGDVLKALNGKGRVAGFATDNHYGWTFIPYLNAFGGRVFRDPPNDLLPALATPEAIAAADYFARLLRDFGPDGVLSYNEDQVVQALKAGRLNYTSIAQSNVTQIGDPGSRVATTAAFGLVPKGPAGRFPGVAVHALGIPAGSKNKDAAWSFIQWALSKQTTRRLVVQKGYSSPTRRSDIESAEFKQRNTINGYDVAKIVQDSVAIAASSGHMKYRTVPVYPQVDQQLNKAIELIVSNQLSAKQAMEQAQAGSIAELKRAGIAL